MTLDADQLRRSFERIETPLHNVLLRLLGSRADCQDLLQDAFARVWARRAWVDADSVDALIYASALNLARNRLRWRKLWSWTGLQDIDLQHDHRGDALARELDLQRALARLRGADRELLLLSEFAGLTTAELAQVLRIAPGTVGSRKHTALQRLRQQLGEQP